MTEQPEQATCHHCHAVILRDSPRGEWYSRPGPAAPGDQRCPARREGDFLSGKKHEPAP